MILFVHTLNGTVPGITDSFGATYTNVGGLMFSTTNLLDGTSLPFFIKYDSSGNYTNGPVFLYEISNSDVALNNSSLALGSGTAFDINYGLTTPNSLEVFHVLTDGVLTGNPFSLSMGNALPPQGGFFNIGELNLEFPGFYTSDFTQFGTNDFQIISANISATMQGIANLTWVQSYEQNVASYLVQQKINAGSFVTIATFTDPTVAAFNVVLNPVLLNSGVISTTFTYQIVTVLIDNAGSKISNQVVIQYPLQAAPIQIRAIAGVAFSLNLLTAGFIFGAGNLPYTFSLLSGDLPPTWTLVPAGILSGTAPIAGSYPCILQITDSLGVVIDVVMEIIILINLAPEQLYEINGAGLGIMYSINGTII
jgi:hypothetical protein